MNVKIQKRSGLLEPLDITKIRKMTTDAIEGLSGVSLSELELEAQLKFIDGMLSSDIQDALIKTAIEKIDIDVPNWTFVAARLFLYDLYHRVGRVIQGEKGKKYCHLRTYFNHAISINRITPTFVYMKLEKDSNDIIELFDLDELDSYIKPERDLQFNYMGIKAAYDKYLIKDQQGRPVELPQQMFMAIAMFLAHEEETKEQRTNRAKEFYDVISKFEVMLATPTLSGARKNRNQLASCFKPETLIQLINMEEEIQNIKVGDHVLTDIGTYEKITEVFERDYTGPIYTLEICGLNKSISATEEHPIKVLIGKEIECRRGGNAKRSGLCIGKQGSKEHCFKKENCHLRDCKDLTKEFGYVWKEINALEKGDFVNISFPRYIYPEKTFDINSLITIKGMIEKDNILYFKNTVGSSRFKPILNETMNPIKNTINIDENFMLMIGYFLAEGHISKDLQNICFTFNINEIEYQNFIYNYFKEAFGIEGTIQNNRDNSTNVIIGSRIITTLMHEICGTGFNTKFLKDIIMYADPKIQKYLLVGVIRGDGCAISNGYQLSLSNEKLTNQLFQIALRCGLSPHMYNPYLHKLATTSTYPMVFSCIDKEFIQLVGKNLHRIKTEMRTNLNNRFWYNEEYYMEIKNIRTEEYSGKVYNIEVENTHTYVVNNISVHNCYIGSVDDNIEGIFDAYKEMGLLSKHGGGIGWDWNDIRAIGGDIDGNKAAAGGPIPFLKINNDIAIAVDQLGCVAKNSFVEVLSETIIGYKDGRTRVINMLDAESNTEEFKYDTSIDFDVEAYIDDLLDTYEFSIKKYSRNQIFEAMKIYLTNPRNKGFRDLIKNKLNISQNSSENLSKAIFKYILECNVIPDGYKEIQYSCDLSDYICNEYGVVRTKRGFCLINPSSGIRNHLHVNLAGKSFPLHRIIYFTWSNSINYASNIDHKDSNKYNNHFTNLQELTHEQNISKGWEETDLQHRVNKNRIRKHLIYNYDLNGSNTIKGKNNMEIIHIKEYIYKKIPFKDVKVGMLAKSFNIDTKTIEPKLIENVYNLEVQPENQISLNYEDGSYTITSIWHPTLVYRNNKFMYIRADEVISGDIGVGGKKTLVKYIESTRPNIDPSYMDLTVKDNNNYFCVTDNIENDTHVIHNTRKGSIAVYVEPWHMNINEFIDLKKNSGEERLRAHDLFPALWIPDLFMERVTEDGMWTLFDPVDVKDLHTLIEEEFDKAYIAYEHNPNIRKETIKAKDLWKKILTSYFESGSPFLCWKDTANRTNPNPHVGRIRSSNLCTEIFQNTSPDTYLLKIYNELTEIDGSKFGSNKSHLLIAEETIALLSNGFTKQGKYLNSLDTIIAFKNPDDEDHMYEYLDKPFKIYNIEKERTPGKTAVCNLASINLSRVNTKEDLERVIPFAVRMLDKVIDLNFYPLKKVKDTNIASRAIGLGAMGEAQYLAENQITFGSQEHFDKINYIYECISYNTIKASSALGREKGNYPDFDGSNWSKGIMPHDHANHNVYELTNGEITNAYSKSEWDILREVASKNMRNGYLMAIAPTSSISILVGTSQAIEAIYKKKWFEEGLSGLIPCTAPNLNPDTWNYYPSAFEVNQLQLIKAAAIRQKWIDQGQSTNIFMSLDKASGKYLNDIYMLAWRLGCKSTYYLRSQSPEAKKAEMDVVDRTIECSGCQ